jgi:hypothetical protein
MTEKTPTVHRGDDPNEELFDFGQSVNETPRPDDATPVTPELADQIDLESIKLSENEGDISDLDDDKAGADLRLPIEPEIHAINAEFDGQEEEGKDNQQVAPYLAGETYD